MLDSVCRDGDFLAIAVGDEASNCIPDDKLPKKPVKVQAPSSCPSCAGGLPPPLHPSSISACQAALVQLCSDTPFIDAAFRSKRLADLGARLSYDHFMYKTDDGEYKPFKCGR